MYIKLVSSNVLITMKLTGVSANIWRLYSTMWNIVKHQSYEILIGKISEFIRFGWRVFVRSSIQSFEFGLDTDNPERRRIIVRPVFASYSAKRCPNHACLTKCLIRQCEKACPASRVAVNEQTRDILQRLSAGILCFVLF